VRLLFRTNIEWNVVLDWVDQAMLINFVGSRIEELRRSAGIRGAIELASVYHQFERGNASEKKFALEVLTVVGNAVGGTAIATHMGYQLYYDPLVNFVWTHWESGRPELTEADEDAERPEDGRDSSHGPPVRAPETTGLADRTDSPKVQGG
jgi:hypothetical protein